MTQNRNHILNIRVSRKTYELIKQKAEENQETLSQTVRKILHDGTDIFQALADDIFTPSQEEDQVVSYTEVVLVRPVACHRCAKNIKSGVKARMGETVQGKRAYYCKSCL